MSQRRGDLGRSCHAPRNPTFPREVSKRILEVYIVIVREVHDCVQGMWREHAYSNENKLIDYAFTAFLFLAWTTLWAHRPARRSTRISIRPRPDRTPSTGNRTGTRNLRTKNSCRCGNRRSQEMNLTHLDFRSRPND